MSEDSSQHFRAFAKVLEISKEKYVDVNEPDLVERQRKQVNGLAALEDQFRLALLNHKFCDVVYGAFFRFIIEVKRNILAARPYFRERQEIFSPSISDAIKNRDIKTVGQYHINYHFVKFATQVIRWGKYSNLTKIARKIEEAREELVVMNLPLVVSRARIFWSRTPKGHLSFMDFVQIGVEGLIAGVDKYSGEYMDNWCGVAIGRMTGNFIENLSLDGDTILETCYGKSKKIMDFEPGDKVWGIDNFGQKIATNVVAIHDHGMVNGFEIAFEDGHKVVCSMAHKFLTQDGTVSLGGILLRNLGVYCEPAMQSGRMEGSLWNGISDQKEVGLASTQLCGMPKEVFRISDTGGDSSTPEKHEFSKVGISHCDIVGSQICIAETTNVDSNDHEVTDTQRGCGDQLAFYHAITRDIVPASSDSAPTLLSGFSSRPQAIPLKPSVLKL